MVSRFIFLLAFAIGGYLLGMKEGIPNLGLLIGVGIGGLGLILEYLFSKIGAGTIFCGLIGLSVGIILSRLVYYPIKNIFSTINGIYDHKRYLCTGNT
jgi:hypothetical protein